MAEARKGTRANPGVMQFFQATPPADRYLSALTIGEIRRGIETIRRRGNLAQAQKLEAWLDQLVLEYAHRILAFDMDCAQVWARLMAPDTSLPIDKQISAIALIHGLDVVTRNTRDFSATGVRLLNPFS